MEHIHFRTSVKLLDASKDGAVHCLTLKSCASGCGNHAPELWDYSLDTQMPTPTVPCFEVLGKRFHVPERDLLSAPGSLLAEAWAIAAGDVVTLRSWPTPSTAVFQVWLCSSQLCSSAP